MSAARDPHLGQPVARAGVPLAAARAAMIMVHGRNASPENILELAAHLDRPGFAYLAPAAANHSWYPFSFMADREKNEPDLSSALDGLRRLVESIEAAGLPRTRIVLLGFSQGACLSAEFAVRHAGRFGGVVALSGGLIGPPGTTWDEAASFAGTPVFLGCSDVDAHIPKVRVEESAAVFTRMGADVTLRLYPGMGHTVSDDELVHAQRVMNQAMA